MSISQEQTSYLPTIHQLAATDTSELKNIRMAASSVWEKQGYPVIQMEDWKYTRLDSLKQKNFHFKPFNSTDFNGALQEHLHAEYYSLVFIDGQVSLELSNLPAVQSIVVEPFSQAVKSHSQIVSQHLGKILNETLHGFTALNLALMREGTFIYLPDKLKLDKPLQLLHVTTPSVHDQLLNYRNLIVVGADCELEIIENFQSYESTTYLANSGTEIFVGSHSKVTHTKIQCESIQANHFATLGVNLAQHARLNSYVFALGGHIARNEIKVNLIGEHAACTLNGFYLATGRQHLAQLTEVDHQQAHCTSEQFYRGILDQCGHGVFQGKVWVRENAQKTIAEQINNNLILSRDAEIDTKPQLQIYADDVQCRHGATVGQLNEESLFYLASRGIPAEVAQGLMLYGFADQVVATLSDTLLQSYVRDLLLSRMPGRSAVKAVL